MNNKDFLKINDVFYVRLHCVPLLINNKWWRFFKDKWYLKINNKDYLKINGV